MGQISFYRTLQEGLPHPVRGTKHHENALYQDGIARQAFYSPGSARSRILQFFSILFTYG
jgi:hypothetical protein